MSELAVDQASTWTARRDLRPIWVLIFCLTLFDAFLLRASTILLQDGDTYWHIVLGQRIWSSGSVPIVDDYSYTMAGTHWIAKEWLSQVLFYSAYAWSGWFGVSFLTAAVAAATYGLLFWWLLQRLEPIAALALSVVGASLGMGSLLARPQIFFYLFVVACICGLLTAVGRRKIPWWLVPWVVLWANLHASFPIAIILTALVSLDAIYTTAPDQRVGTAIRWAALCGAMLAATGLTPYGYEPLLVALRITNDSATAQIQEWRPLAFDVPGVYAAVYLAASLAIVLAEKRSLLRAAPLVASAALMIRHVRFFLLFGIVAVAVVADPVARRYPRLAHAPRTYGNAPQGASALALALVCVTLLFALKVRPEPAAAMTPRAALTAADQAGLLSGRVYNDYNFGAYLIFRNVKTFIDSRTELYFGGFLLNVMRAVDSNSDQDFLALLDRNQVTWALVNHNSPSAERLRRSASWSIIHEDEIADVFGRR